MLVPHLTGGSSPELDALRTACRVVIGRVCGPGRRLAIVGAGPSDAAYGPAERGSLAGFGVTLEVPLGSPVPGPVTLPPALTVGAWLVCDALGPGSGAVGHAVADALPVELASDREDTALVVVGDGSATRTDKAPRPFDPRGADHDAALAAALRAGDPGGLAALGRRGDPPAVHASGTGVWAAVARLVEGVDWDAELVHEAAPFGVGYVVAVWRRR